MPPTSTGHTGSSVEQPFLELLSWQEMITSVNKKIKKLIQDSHCNQNVIVL